MLKVTILGIVAALLTVYIGGSIIVLPPVAVKVADNPVTRTPAEIGLAYENITVDSEGVALEGWWMPVKEARGVVIFVHGAGSNRTSSFIKSLELYATLVDMQFSVVTVDLRNHGNSPKTDGTLDMGADEWRDVMAMAQWLDANDAQKLPRVLMGASMGGAASIHALARGLEVDRLILFDPALNTADSLAMGAYIETGIPSIAFDLYAWSATHLYGMPSGDSDAGALARDIRIPTLLIQDPDDPITRMPFATELASDNPSIQLMVAPEVNPSAACLADKGRWGTHVAAFACHQEWTKTVLADFLATIR